MKNVLFLINTLRNGGAEKVLVDTVNNLDPYKYRVTVQTLLDDGIYVSSLAKHISYKPTITCKNNFLRRILGKLFFAGSAKLIYLLFVRDNYDFEIAFLEGLPTKIISRSTNSHARKYAWIHTDLIAYPHSYRTYGSEEKEGKAYSHFDTVFCVSNSVKSAFISKYSPQNVNVKTLYNIVDDQKIVSLAKLPVDFPTDTKPCLISVGRLIPPKGFDRLLRIHKRLLDVGLQHSLIIIGDGELYPTLQQFILDNDLSHSAFLLGFQINPYMYMSKADLFICSSYAEGFSTVITESLLCGTPIIGTAVSGNNEPFELPRCSLIVENDDDALFNALHKVLTSPDILFDFKQGLPYKQSFFKKEHLLSEFESAVFL